MKILLPPPANSSAAPRELDTDTAELGDILAYIEEAQAQGRLAHLAAIRALCHERLAKIGNYEDLSEGEWTVFDAVNQSLATLLRAVIPRIVADETPRGPLDLALPFLASLDKSGLEALLAPASTDDDIRLFREFYSAKFDYESDDSDEEDEDEPTARGAKTRRARKKRTKGRKKTARIYHDVDPSGALIRARMDKIADGYGRAYGEKSEESQLQAALKQQAKYKDASAEVARADEAFGAWVNKQVDAMETGPREELENLGVRKRDPKAMKRFVVLLKGKSDALREMRGLEKRQKDAGTALRSWNALTSAAVADLKGMSDWRQHMDANTVIHHPAGTWTAELLEELAAVNDALLKGKKVPESRFVVAQYRGIAYNTDVFDAVARRRSRESVELKLPVYCSSVFSAAGVSPADYYAGAYASNAEVNRRLANSAEQLKAVLVEKRLSGPITLDPAVRGVLRGEKVPENDVDAGKYQHKLRWNASAPLIYSNAAYALQNFYTINYSGFFTEVRATLQRSSAAKSTVVASTVEPSPTPKVEAGPLDEVLGGLLNGGNPLVSAGYIPRHALRYAYAVKYYSGAEKKSKLFPQWRPDDGRAIHPYAGKVFVALHPAEDYTKATGPLDVVVLHKAKEIDVPSDILAEREAAFPAFIPADRVVAEHVARYPSFTTDYDRVYLDKYGMSKEDYESYQTLSGFVTSNKAMEILLDALSEWLVRYHEARLIELARRLAERDNKVLVYRDLDGLLVPGEDVVDITPVTGVRSASSNDTSRTTLGASLEGRSSEDREELGPVPVVPQAAVPLVGIYNYGNECYLNSALQVLQVFGPAARYERAEGARVGVALARATDTFLAKLTRDAADGTYVTEGLATYTNQNTVAIRRQLRDDGRIRTLYTQEDACDAMLAVLRAYDHGGLGFDDSPAWLRDHQGEFAARRPSQLHMLVRITTTYELGAAANAVAGGELALNADRQFTSYDVVNILRLALPAPGDAPVPYADLLEANRDRVLVGDDRTTARCLHNQTAYPNARRDRERTERLGDLPADFFVQLKRFSGGLAPVEQPKKPTETTDKKPTTDQPPTVVKSTTAEPTPTVVKSTTTEPTPTVVKSTTTEPTPTVVKSTTTEPSPTVVKSTTTEPTPTVAKTTGGTQASVGAFQAAKIETLVDMPLALDSGHRLSGIILHLGKTIAGGHYKAYVRHGEQWYEVNDPFVTAVADVTEPRQSGYVFYYRNG